MMNKVVRELALESGLYFYIKEDTLYPQVLSAEECFEAYDDYAARIITECLHVLNKRYMGDNNREDMEVRRCIEDVKKHFGVKL